MMGHPSHDSLQESKLNDSERNALKQRLSSKNKVEVIEAGSLGIDSEMHNGNRTAGENT